MGVCIENGTWIVYNNTSALLRFFFKEKLMFLYDTAFLECHRTQTFIKIVLLLLAASFLSICSEIIYLSG